MPNRAAEFNHLDHILNDHILNDLVRSGAVVKTWEQCYAHDFKNGVSCRWRVDPMIAAVDAGIKNGSIEVRAMTADEVSTFAAAIVAEGHVDVEYASAIPPEGRTIPVLVVSVTPDLHPDVGSIVVDGNHRIVASYRDGLSCFYAVVPERIERMFRFDQEGHP